MLKLKTLHFSRYGAYYADVSRGSKKVDNETGTQTHVRDIRQVRLDIAVSLGYKSYAEMSMDTKMAGSVETVQALIKNLSGKAKQGQEAELEALQKYAESRGFTEEIELFDVEYFRLVFTSNFHVLHILNFSLITPIG